MMLMVTFSFDDAWMQVFAASGGLRFTLCVVEKENDAGGCDGVGDDDDDVDATMIMTMITMKIIMAMTMVFTLMMLMLMLMIMLIFISFLTRHLARSTV